MAYRSTADPSEVAPAGVRVNRLDRAGAFGDPGMLIAFVIAQDALGNVQATGPDFYRTRCASYSPLLHVSVVARDVSQPSLAELVRERLCRG